MRCINKGKAANPVFNNNFWSKNKLLFSTNIIYLFFNSDALKPQQTESTSLSKSGETIKSKY